MIQYLQDQKSPYQGIVYSGQNLPKEFAAGALEEKKCYLMGHYLSTSKNNEIAMRFAKIYPEEPILMKFSSKSGTYIKEFSASPIEEEILFPPGTVLQYVRKNINYFNILTGKYNQPNVDNKFKDSEFIQLFEFNEVTDSEISSVCHVASKSEITKVYLYDMD